MHGLAKQKVSLRGASAKEITRDALLERTARERAQRSQARRAISAALLIQRVWRGCYAACRFADGLRADWDAFIAVDQRLQQPIPVDLLCNHILRPFIFFVGYHRFSLHWDSIPTGDHRRFVTCFKILLQSISCCDPDYNFCSLSIGSEEEHTKWLFQVQKILKLCGVALSKDLIRTATQEATASLSGLAIRLLVALTDVSLWKSIDQAEGKAKARHALQGLLEWMVNGGADLYPALRHFVFQFCPLPCDGDIQNLHKDDFVMIASSITIALRPLQNSFSECVGGSNASMNGLGTNHRSMERKAAEHFCKYILTIPFITQRLPAAILPALRHSSVFIPCLQAFGTSVKFIFEVVPSPSSFSGQYIHSGTLSVVAPWSAWALANVVTLALGPFQKNTEINSFSGQFISGLDCVAYIKAVCSLLEHVIPWIENLQLFQNKISDGQEMDRSDSCNIDFTDGEKIGRNSADNKLKILLIEQFGTLCQQWHLKQLLERAPRRCGLQDAENDKAELFLGLAYPYVEGFLKLPDIAKIYVYLLTIFAVLNPVGGALPVLNLLAFTQDLLVRLWEWIEENVLSESSVLAHNSATLESLTNQERQRKKAGFSTKDEGFGRSFSTKWASALSKMKGKSSNAESIDVEKMYLEKEAAQKWNPVCVMWNIEPFRKGPGGISESAVPVLHLFCAAYGHLLLVLDDEEFYEREVPFTLEQQRCIAASLNTMIYNGIFSSSKHEFASLMETSTRCLHSLYMRDCRRNFCPSSLWLAPAATDRPPIAAAARAHEVAASTARMGDVSQVPALGFVLNNFPHIWPFEERVQIFREFVKVDKTHRKMAGEVIGPGPGSIEIAVRRGHIVEDGFTQLNPLGAKLKLGINVSFVNEHGLPEAGLDYGGLFKEFLTDLAKAAFDPGYGLFIQTATDEGLLFPHSAAANLGHGLQMIEFLGRIVGKALYEGILLDYTFSHVFAWKLLGRYSFMDELSTLDPELHRNLIYLKHYDGDTRDLALDFTVTEENFGKRSVVELKRGGADILVTNENKLQYMHAMADYKLNQQIKPLVDAFLRGLSDIIAPSWLGLFNAREFNQLLSGGEHDFNVDDLKGNTRYTGGYTENSRIVKHFWEVVRGFEPEERCALLKFVTSCSRAPLLGFRHLQPAFTIHKVSCDAPIWAMLGGQDVERLPSASTCYNTLKLPTYKRISTLKNKLQYAIRSNPGFELS